MAKKKEKPIDPDAYERSLKAVAEAQARYLEAAAKVKVPGAAFYDGYDGGNHAVVQDGKTKTVTPQTNGAIGKGDRVMVAGGQMTAMPHKSPPPKQPPGKTDKRGKIKFLFCSRELYQEKMYTTFWVAGWRENRRDFAFRVPLEAPDKEPGMTSKTEILGAIVNNKGKDDWVVGVAYLEIYDFASVDLAPTRYLTIAHIENGREKWRIRKKVPDTVILIDPKDRTKGIKPYRKLQVRALGWGYWIVHNWTEEYSAYPDDPLIETVNTIEPSSRPNRPLFPNRQTYMQVPPEYGGGLQNYEKDKNIAIADMYEWCPFEWKETVMRRERRLWGLGTEMTVFNKNVSFRDKGSFTFDSMNKRVGQSKGGTVRTEVVWIENEYDKTIKTPETIYHCDRPDGGENAEAERIEYIEWRWYQYWSINPPGAKGGGDGYGEFYRNHRKIGKQTVPEMGEPNAIFQDKHYQVIKASQGADTVIAITEKYSLEDKNVTFSGGGFIVDTSKPIREYELLPPRGGNLSPGQSIRFQKKDKLTYEMIVKLGNESYEPLSDTFTSINVSHNCPQPNWQAVDIYRRNPPNRRVYDNGMSEENHSGTTITYINANLTAKKYAPPGIRNESVPIAEDVIKKSGLYKAAAYLITEIGQGPIEPFPDYWPGTMVSNGTIPMPGTMGGEGGYGECVFTEGGAVPVAPFATKAPYPASQTRILTEMRYPSLFMLAILGECVVCTYTDWRELKKNRRTEKIYAGEKMFPNRLKNIPFEKGEDGLDIPKPAQYTFWNMSYNPL